MALTQVSTKGIKDAEVKTADIADENVTLAKLEHGTSGNNGKFLRANNGADPTWETVDTSIADDSIAEVKLDIHAAPSGTDKYLAYTSNGMEWATVDTSIADDSIAEVKLDIHAAPSGTDKVLGYTSNGMEWIVAAAGATGGSTNKVFWENDQTVTADYTITNNQNAGTWGPVTINSGVTVTIGDGEYWTIM